MKLNKITLAVLILTLSLMITMFSSCQLSKYMGEDGGNGTESESPSGSSGIPEGVDINYTMDYMNEDLTKYVKLGDYKNMSVKVETYEVNDKYIEKKIEELLKSQAVPQKITDRKTKEGDVICVDYTGTLDGVAFYGGTATNVAITLSENSGYIPGFTDGMYDVMPGDTVSYSVTFPDSYPNSPDLEGKETVFTVTVHYIEGEKTIVPELTDKYVSENFGAEGCETVEQFMTYYKDYLTKTRDDQLREDIIQAVWNKVMENVETVALPKKAVDALYWNNRSKYESDAAQYNMSYDNFLSAYVGITDEEMLEYTEAYVKEDIVIYSIVKAENLAVTDKEYEEGVKKYMEEYNMTEEELIETYGEERIKSVLQWNKLMDAIVSWNNVEEVIVTE
ncbi:MAG: trigger factor [Clostridia bacterium]|nr:trigger factor [Clostridia bacterium]